jgi:hypothetical protein
MNEVLTATVLTLATAAIVVILVLTARRNRSRAGKDFDAPPPQRSPAGAGRRWPCPVCGALLGHGERIRSIVRLSQAHGRIMEISGCPRCLPPADRSRSCPVCRADLGPNDVLVARVFDRSQESAKPHVHVLGCSRCKGR